ncbi:MAG TPA: cyclase family protein [Pyrinomonadaceae bacterium]|jgi:kynurenine formamidase|nr:cyclase family protein [Pyrinomonadaceae bacterium]
MTKLSIQINSQIYKIDADEPLSIAIPLQFNGAQPNAYGVEPAISEPCEAGEMVGDTRRGGSVNFEQYKFIPHCNGTHTECVGHLTHERIFVNDCLKDAFVLASLISAAPEKASETDETYAVELSDDDLLITRKTLEKALEAVRSQRGSDALNLEQSEMVEVNPVAAVHSSDSLIIRTLPNDESKLTRTYLEKIPPFFTTEAIKFIRELGVKHLLVDLPSIDRIFDEGKLSNHRFFWNVGQGAFETSAASLIYHTITELIFVPDEIADGIYLLNLQIAPFVSDASPSRPILFALQ